MSEYIPYTSELETTPERFFWDQILRANEKLADIGDIDFMEEVELMANEPDEDALTRTFNNALFVMVEEGHSSDLLEVFSFLNEQGFELEDFEVE